MSERGIELEINEVKQLIKEAWRSGYRGSWLLLGPPGVGKTEGIQQLCEELAKEEGLQFIVYDDSKFDAIMKERSKYWVHVEFAASIAEPADFLGVPRESNGYTRYRPLAWVKALASGKGSLFLDEITNVHRPDTQSAMLRVVLERMVGYTALHEDVLVIAAGNKQEHSSLALPLNEPMRAGKVTIIDVKAPSVSSWIEYMDRKYGEKWDRRVAVYLMKFSEHFLEARWSEGYNALRSPRGWTKLSLLSHKLSKEEFVHAVARGLVGEEAAIHFCAFLRIKPPELEKLEADPRAWNTLSDDTKYFAVLEIANRKLNAIKECPKLLTYLAERDREMLNLLMVLLPEKERTQFVMALRKQLPQVFQALLRSAIVVSKLKAGDLG
jgi:DNA polymerase III delta prime subunit